MPGDVLLFRGLSHSTIGAVRFHGRVRDGIGWVTDAMVTKQWSRRVLSLGFNRCMPVLLYRYLADLSSAIGQLLVCRAVIDGGIHQA